MTNMTVWTATSEDPSTIVEDGMYIVTLSNGKEYTKWNKTEFNGIGNPMGMDRFYLSKQERDDDIVPKLFKRITDLEAAITDRLQRKALTIFIESEEHVVDFFAPLEKALTDKLPS